MLADCIGESGGGVSVVVVGGVMGMVMVRVGGGNYSQFAAR